MEIKPQWRQMLSDLLSPVDKFVYNCKKITFQPKKTLQIKAGCVKQPAIYLESRVYLLMSA